ncbi:hypothetical protein IEQ34_006471 [Dendrobium chrysotoxum]|uniref:Uncharacterized protein n=1 Tax=Dendrobium chrysotoxum TaxID=161865 RepID=A0AAV7HFY6_DENCH|nr:hypothetical protein IEQ34_006471 [Dendrobium chrysotoxum]
MISSSWNAKLRLMEASRKGKGISRKRSWRSEEDETLIKYIKINGLGNWNLVGKNSGLSRDGKSCRLRWLNHLQPGLKKNLPFSEKEKLVIFSEHAVLGNKWSDIARQLPGRTDNEIKNFMNIHKKKCLKNGVISIYPPEISMKYTDNGTTELPKIASSGEHDSVVHQLVELMDLPSIQNTEKDVIDILFSPYLHNPQSSFELLPQPQLAAAHQSSNASLNNVLSPEQCSNLLIADLLYSDYSMDTDLDSWLQFISNSGWEETSLPLQPRLLREYTASASRILGPN